MIDIRKTEVFAKWLDCLNDTHARTRILVRIERLATGNPGDVKPVGEGISELRNYGITDYLWSRLSGLLQENRTIFNYITCWR